MSVLYHNHLVKKLKEGDHEAFEQVYDLYKDRIIGNLLRILKDRSLVEELTQDLFLQIWNNKEDIDLEKSFKAYVFTIANNLAKNALKRAYHDLKMRSAILSVSQQSYEHIEQEIEIKDNKKLLYDLLDILPPKRKHIFILCKIEGKTYEEVSQMLNVSHNTINDHIYKANLTLKKYCIDKNVLASAALLYCLNF